ncbi:lysine-specific demethylase 6B isoform X2 [Pseudoliparis swirei]|uniref:lysine-specific demethylase 6B isoform X2 n=1 Tax=Pseudoliparis swirei TaxID=2059687 RepID=UPI0024BE431E|nr:lysine-specific demethylase 6B isoform X2 [Pseudoliparis swirei]
MSSWAKSSAAARRPTANMNPNGSGQQLRMFRRGAPYPNRDERTEEPKDVLESYEELEQNYSGSVKYEGYKHQPNAKLDGCTPADRRKALYQKFYRQVQEERKLPDCVVLSVTNRCLPLTPSPLMLQFPPVPPVHRNMPKDQAMDFVATEYSRRRVKERPLKDPADSAAKASQLLDDFLEREKIERHAVPSETRQLLLLLADGVHLYPEEMESISEYVRSRQDHTRASNTEGQRGNMLPPGLGKPPPLLPTPPGPPQPQSGGGAGGSLMDHPLQPAPLLSSPGSYPKTKPPPLLSLHRPPGPSLGASSSRGPQSLHNPYGGPSMSRGPLLHHLPLYHPGPRGPLLNRGGPPSLKSCRPPLLASPGALLPRPSGPRH